MPHVHAVKVEPLTEESFKPFGQVMEVKDREPDFRGGGVSRGWFVDFQVDGTPSVHVSQVICQGLTFKRMERHLAVTQGFIPLYGMPAVVAVAAPTHHADPQAVPRPQDVHGFLIDGTKGYLFHKGTWHTLDRFPLNPPAGVFVILSSHETTADLRLAYQEKGGFVLTQEVDFEKKWNTICEFHL
jgi:ureidoglycolate hydrolase